jgi:hypothetical protein
MPTGHSVIVVPAVVPGARAMCRPFRPKESGDRAQHAEQRALVKRGAQECEYLQP